jgi:hypothetical protein
MAPTIRAAIAAAALGLSASAASAQWVHSAGEDDPFAGGALQLAMSFSEMGEMVAFRCTTSADLAFMYVSMEKPTDDLAANLPTFAAGKPALLVVVDDDPVVRLPAAIEITPDHERLRYVAVGAAVAPLAQRVGAARKRVAIAFEFNGQRVQSTAVNVRGSKSVMSKLVTACRLGADSAAAR